MSNTIHIIWHYSADICVLLLNRHEDIYIFLNDDNIFILQ